LIPSPSAPALAQLAGLIAFIRGTYPGRPGKLMETRPRLPVPVSGCGRLRLAQAAAWFAGCLICRIRDSPGYVIGRIYGGPLTSMGKRPVGKVALLVGGAAVIAVSSASVVPGCVAGHVTGQQSGLGDAGGGDHFAQLASTGQHTATLAVVTAAATLTVTAAPMPGRLMQVSTPGNSGVRPQLAASAGRVRLALLGIREHGPSAVSVELSTAVSWQLQFSGGTNQALLNLGNGQVAGIDFSAGSSLIQMTLPRPVGTATITLAGGASQVNLTTPPNVATRLRLYAGASAATLAGQTHNGLARGTVLSSPGWAEATSRYDIDAPAGINDITVTG